MFRLRFWRSGFGFSLVSLLSGGFNICCVLGPVQIVANRINKLGLSKCWRHGRGYGFVNRIHSEYIV